MAASQHSCLAMPCSLHPPGGFGVSRSHLHRISWRTSSTDGGKGACAAPNIVAPVLGGLPLGPQLLSIASPSKWTFFPSIFTVIEPGAMNLAGPWVLAEISPPPVPLLAMSPMLSNVEPRIATVLPSILTVVE